MPIRLALALLVLVATPLLAAPEKEVVREQRRVTVDGDCLVALGTKRIRIHATHLISTCSTEPEDNRRTHYISKVIEREVL